MESSTFPVVPVSSRSFRLAQFMDLRHFETNFLLVLEYHQTPLTYLKRQKQKFCTAKVVQNLTVLIVVV